MFEMVFATDSLQLERVAYRINGRPVSSNDWRNAFDAATAVNFTEVIE